MTEGESDKVMEEMASFSCRLEANLALSINFNFWKRANSHHSSASLYKPASSHQDSVYLSIIVGSRQPNICVSFLNECCLLYLNPVFLRA